MSVEIGVLLASVVLLFAQITIQAMLLTAQQGSEYNAGPRDEGVTLTGKAGRAKRMVANFLETYPAFIALALATAVLGASGWLTQAGALIYLGARIAYIPLYLYGVPYIRSVCWIVSAVGLLMILAGLIF